MEKWHTLFVLVLVAVSLLAFGCIETATGKAGGNGGGGTPGDGGGGQPVANASGNGTIAPASSCAGVGDDIKRDACYRREALDAKQSSLCSKIAQASTRDACAYDIALALKSPAECGGIGDKALSDYCYSFMAKDAKDASLCSAVKDAARHDACVRDIALDTNSAAACRESLDEERERLCVRELAMRANSSAVCSDMRKAEWRESCIAELAVMNNDAKACAGLAINSMHDNCYFLLATDNLPDKEDLCDPVRNSTLKDECYRRMALLNRNIYMCENVSDYVQEKWCSNDIAVSLNNTMLCNRFRPSNVATALERAADNIAINCLAVVKKNYTMCGEITNDTLADGCRGNVTAR